jgi:hypothetical protein
MADATTNGPGPGVADVARVYSATAICGSSPQAEEAALLAAILFELRKMNGLLEALGPGRSDAQERRMR